MGPVEAKLHCIVDKFRSWIPRRTETSDTSRIFWMPDQSCRVCYECDLPFTIFNRRHHCRICGRVFCGRCTVNTIPSAFAEGRNYEQEDRERIRVCIFCFKQWERETMPAKCNGLELLSPGISPSLSCTSLASSESSGNSNSTNSSSIRSIMPHKAVPYQHIAYSSRLNLVEANGLDQGRNSDNTDLVSILESEGPTSSTFGISTNRNEDEDDEYTKLFEDPEQCISRKPGENYQDSSMNCPSVYSFNKVNSVDLSSKISMDQDFLRKTQTSGEQFIEEKMLGSSQTVSPGTENPFLVMQERSGEESESTDNGDECNDESPMFESTSPESEQPIDIENNGIIWIPPEPEDEEDEKENSVFDDDDDDGGGWALPHSTGSFTDSEYKSKDRVSEEHRKAMTAVLDGHFRALVAQLLKAENVPVGEENNKESWLEIVTSLSWQAASLVKPDTSKGGGGMDPGGYVKVKCLACGHPYQSEVIKGVVCKKNIANRRMTKSYKNPRLLILGGALEYQRVSNVLSSLDTLIQQEMEHLKMTVAKVEAHHPNVLLVEKTVSRPAQDYLLAKEISLVLNIKRSLLERIARCTGAQIVPSVDNLTAAKVGHCESFHVDKFVEEHDSAGQTGRNPPKTLMFFEGCPKPLGCTVLLKGSNSDELKKVKRVVQYSVFAAYHLAVETSFLADEGATLPELSLKSPITVALPDKISNLGRSISTIPGFMIPTSVQINKADMHFPAKGALTENSVVQQNDMHAIPENVSCLPSSGHLISELSSSIKKTFEGAVLFSSSKSHEGFATSFNSADQRSNSSIIDDSLVTCTTGFLGHQFPMEEKSQDLQLESQENMEDQLKAISFMDHKIIGHDNHNNMHSEGQRPSKEDFPPPDQQSILVSLSTRCVWKGTICERAHLFRIKYYGSFDKPLGRFLRDDLFNQNYRCNSCDAPTEAHVHCYTHQQGSLTIAVKRLDETVLPGEREGKIWMWHLCVKCTRKTRKPLPTRRVVMSDSACALSFGKFLELSFSNHAAASGAANCGHSLHRDCLRFYGFGRMVACFRYAPIHVHSVHLPPPKLEFNDPNQQEWLTKEISDVEDKAELLFAEVFDSLRQIGEKIASSGSFYVGTKVPESRRKITEYEGILQKEKTYLEDMIQKSIVKEHKPGQPIADILELNRVRFKLNCQSREWKNRLQFLASFLKRPPGSSTSSIPEELNLLLQKEKDKDDGVDNLSIGEKTLQRNRVEKYDGDACKIVAPAAEGNGYISGENVEDNSGISEKLKSGGTLVIKKQGITLASSIEDSFQNHLLNDSFMSRENIDNGLGAVDKMNKSLETGKLKLLQHDETNINVSYNDSSTVKQALTCHPLSTDVNGNRICRILRENKLTDTVDGGDKKDYFVGDSEFNRTLSEGKVKKCVNLSDTLDAAWTGEGQSIEPQVVKITSQGQEVGPGLAFENACADTEPVFRNKHDPLQVEKKISPTALKAESMDYIANVQDKSEQERLQVSSPTSPVKSDISEEFGSWIGTSFSDLYKTYTKNFQGSLSGLTPRFDSLDNHIPSFVSSVSQLGDQGGARLSLVPGVGDIIIVIYDDEPTSIIAYALTSHEYHTQISDKNKQKEREREKEKEIGDSFGIDAAHFYSLQASEGSDLSEVTHREKSYGSHGSFTSGSKGAVVSDPFLFDKAMHVKVSFDDESLGWKVKYTVTCYYAVQFEALRKKCCSTELDFIRSLCRCRKWGAKGGKSNVFFAKTLDDRFIVKQVTKTELESFMKFAPEYFKYLSDSLSTGSPTCLAKILGIYQVTTKQAKGGREVKMDLMIMENLLYGRNVTRLYDLKGSVRSRYNPDSTGSNKVLLDQNLIEAMPTSPIFVGNKAKRLLERAVWNDTAFLALIDVMDYSLLVGVDEMRHELVLGIIDFLRQYTWDKHLETWVKASGILGGPKNTSPTVISPKQYKKRFRKAMSTYFLMVPDQWTPPTVDSSISHTDIREDVAPTIVQGDPP